MFKKFFLGLFLVFFGLFLTTLLLPTRWSVEKSILIQRSPEVIYPHLVNFRAWEKWSPWTKEDYDSNMTFAYEGVESQIGSKQYRQSRRGYALLTLTQTFENRYVQYEMETAQYTLEGSFTLIPQGEATQVIWKCYSENGKNPLKKSMQLVLTPEIEQDFIKGLTKLKTQLE